MRSYGVADATNSQAGRKSAQEPKNRNLTPQSAALTAPLSGEPLSATFSKNEAINFPSVDELIICILHGSPERGAGANGD